METTKKGTHQVMAQQELATTIAELPRVIKRLQARQLPQHYRVRLIWDDDPQNHKKTPARAPKEALYSKNKQANALLQYVHETGGIDRKTAEHLAESREEFRASFAFKHDQ